MDGIHDLTKGHIPTLIRKIAVPASVGFFFHTMYNVVDTYYAGFISTEALAALSLSFPLFFIILAMSSGVSTGTTALISNSLGEGNKEKAKDYAAQAVSFGVLLSIVLTILGLVLSPSLARLLGASGSYLSITLSYINVIFYGTVTFVLIQTFNSSLVATGDTKKLRNYLIIGFFLNLVLDPWFLLGGFGLPPLGFAGIALATVIIQLLGAIYIGWNAVMLGMLSKDFWKRMIPRKQLYLDIASQGFPASMNMMTVAIGIFVITYFVSWFGQNGVAAYGIAVRIEQIAVLPTVGLHIAALSLVGQNNGAKKFSRILETYKKTITYGLYTVTIGYVLVALFARQLMQLFTTEAGVVSVGVQYLHISLLISWSYALLFVTISTLQGMKKPMAAIWIGIYRQIVAPLIAFPVLASLFGLMGIWWGIFIISWSAALITILYGRMVMKGIVG
ncbi:MATE family efflux transporter [Candidatus Woesearchaeota archaeon]|nr:MATE family efflux transporter [Candidatus Woesearchaeota archaeon]